MQNILVIILLSLHIVTIYSQNPIDNCPQLPPHTPANVNDLSPQNIDVVMSLGDSITAGFGILGRSGGLEEYRGLSGPIGSDAEALTLTNFIKHYNPNVWGGSYGEHLAELPTTPHYTNDVLNAAQSGATTNDFDDQVAYLIDTIKANPNISMEDSWKFINILIGANDVCNQCWDFNRPTPAEAAATYALNIELTIEQIYENFPKTLINILPLFNLSGVYNLSLDRPYCKYFHDVIPFECDCAFDSDYSNRVWLDDSVTLMGQQVMQIAKRWQAKQYPDFNVIYQPFSYYLELTELPIYFLSDLDCFHPSLIAHQAIAMSGWNSLIVPMAQKPITFDPNVTISCATTSSRFFTS